MKLRIEWVGSTELASPGIAEFILPSLASWKQPAEKTQAITRRATASDSRFV